eukprot:gnl/MRDRNA2_/MRDRNA2_29098_c0_seq1.p1 gnl/MRDRNA2_/MRDRNA2_29098_c0~~gnl/MRDRNA2_/MRDRNA2_29098_c0_seq1.p1  ORF type:complete len:178 (-),score=34.99 gnl/MRDRNA2_/MRDRNA2_29098_c0_seq1:309-842(-)
MVFTKTQEAQHAPFLKIESLASLGLTKLHFETFPPSTVSNEERSEPTPSIEERCESTPSIEKRRSSLEKSLETLDNRILCIKQSILEQEEKATTALLEGDKRCHSMAMKERKKLEHLMCSLNDMQLTLKRRSAYLKAALKHKIAIHDDACSDSTFSGRSSSSLCSHSSSSLCSLSEA